MSLNLNTLAEAQQITDGENAYSCKKAKERTKLCFAYCNLESRKVAQVLY